MIAESPPSADEKRVLAEVLRAIRRTTFGTIQLFIQDSRVVQIDRTEKLRLDR